MQQQESKARVSLASIGVEDVRELLSKGWMTHDATWFAHSTVEVGIQKTNEINRAAVRSMALVEVKRIKKLLGVQRVTTPEELEAFVRAASAFIKPRFMKYELTFPEPGVLRWRWEQGQCFAFQGIKSLGLLDEYRCGIYVRVQAWLEGLNLPFEMTPDTQRCLMLDSGCCQRTFRVTFPA